MKAHGGPGGLGWGEASLKQSLKNHEELAESEGWGMGTSDSRHSSTEMSQGGNGPGWSGQVKA